MKALSPDTFLARLLGRLAVLVCRHPRWFVYPQIVLFLACVYYTVTCLQFSTSRNDLVDANLTYHQNFLRFRKEFPQPDDIVVVIESDNIEKNRQFAERIGAKLQAETNLFSDVFYKGDLPMMGAKALLFVPDKDLASLKQTLHGDLPFIEKFTQTTNLVSFFEQINTAFRTASRDTNAQTESLIQSLPALTRIVAQADKALSRLGTPSSPGVTALFDAGD